MNSPVTQFSDYVSYWLGLFPEINTVEELDKIFINVSKVRVADLEERLCEKDMSVVEELIDKAFSCPKLPIMNRLSSNLKSTMVYYYFFEPILNLYTTNYFSRLVESDFIDDVDVFIENLIPQLLHNLFQLAERTIILEINVARMEGLLEGKTPHERFSHFTDVLLKDKQFLTALYREYTGLTELMVLTAQNYYDFMLEIISNSQKEKHILSQRLNSGADLGKIKTIITGLGDTHQGGKTVSFLYFDSGQRIVYKPRHTDIEEAFQQLLVWLGEQTKDTALLDNKTIQIHSAAKCGWIEFVDFKECNSHTEADKFYTRIGQLMCILYALNARDFHYENILAGGEYPILLDLESLFHSNQGLHSGDQHTAMGKAADILDRSVYSLGLLPQKLTNPTDKFPDKSIDVSGLGGEGTQISPFQGMFVVNSNSDNIKLENQYGTITVKDNTPKIDGKVQKSDEYIDSIKTGYLRMYKWIQENKALFMDKLVTLYSGKQNRYILRPTYLYGQLLSTSYHPDFHREPIHREVLLHRVGIGFEENSTTTKLLNSELQDLLSGEVPYFNIIIDSHAIVDSRNKRITGYLTETPMNESKQKVSSFSNADLDQQLRFIDMSFLAKTNDSRKDQTNISFMPCVNHQKLTPHKWTDLAAAIGEHMIEKSIGNDSDSSEEITWISTILEGRNEVTWSLAPVGIDMYNGNSGIALFLGYLGVITQRADFIQAALKAATPLRKTIESLAIHTNHPFTIGAFSGISGYFYTLSKLCTITGDKDLERFVIENLQTWKQFLNKDTLFDVVSGSAGSLGVALSLARSWQDESINNELLAMAISISKHIQANSKALSQDGIAWGNNSTLIPYSGFAHGNAGIAAYLGKLSAVTGDDSIRPVITAALQLERSLYSDKHKNWYPSLERDRISSGWCHGAPGILLSKTMLMESGYEDEHLKGEISIALDTTLSNGFGFNTSLCHGDLGNIEILNYVAKATNNRELSNRCTATFQELFDKVLTHKWKDGLWCGTESMGLMIGLAGIGYSLLKHSEPELVPGVLVLE